MSLAMKSWGTGEMDPWSRYPVDTVVAAKMATAAYYYDDSGRSRHIPYDMSNEGGRKEYDDALAEMAATVGPGWKAKVLVNNGNDVVIGFINPNGDPAGVGIRGTDDLMKDREEYRGVVYGEQSDLTRKRLRPYNSSPAWTSDLL